MFEPSERQLQEALSLYRNNILNMRLIRDLLADAVATTEASWVSLASHMDADGQLSNEATFLVQMWSLKRGCRR